MCSNDTFFDRRAPGRHQPLASRNAIALLVVFAVVALGISGCGDGRPDRVPVSGQVLIDGQPLTLGYIRFVPEGTRPSGGEIGPDGRFTLTCFDGSDGAVPGRHRVEVVAREQLGPTTARLHAPRKYLSADTSGLEVEVTGPTDSLLIELSWDGGRPFLEKDGRTIMEPAGASTGTR